MLAFRRDDVEVNRRDSLALFSLAALGGATLARSPASGAPSGFDPMSPTDNLNGFVKVMGDLSGQPYWMIAQGRIYALEEGEMPIPLVGVHGLRYIKFTGQGDSYAMSLRDWGYYTDYATGEFLETFTNPYTGATVHPEPLLTSYFSWRMGPDGQEIEGYTGEAWLKDRPLQMPWIFQGDKTTVTLELLVKYGDGGYGAEWVNLTTNTIDFADTAVTAAPMEFAWTGYSPWMRWLDMGDRPGRTLWNSNGIKSKTLAALDPDIRAIYERFNPGSLDNPETYDKTSGTTSTGED